PLLQSWFAQAHPERSPYRLYALSNLGSLAGLLAFPFVVEPGLGLQMQAWTWSFAYVAFLVLTLACARVPLARARRAVDAFPARVPSATPSLTASRPARALDSVPARPSHGRRLGRGGVALLEPAIASHATQATHTTHASH